MLQSEVSDLLRRISPPVSEPFVGLFRLRVLSDKSAS